MTHPDTRQQTGAPSDAFHPPSVDRILQTDRDQLAERFSRLFGNTWQSHVARALDKQRQVVFRFFRPRPGRRDFPPTYLYAIAELLEATPRKKWPDRWK